MNKDIEKILNWLRTDGTVFISDIDKIEKYIEELEKERQAVIDKLKEDIYNIKSNPEYDYVGTEWREHEVVGTLEEILNILEGENERN